APAGVLVRERIAAHAVALELAGRTCAHSEVASAAAGAAVSAGATVRGARLQERAGGAALLHAGRTAAFPAVADERFVPAGVASVAAGAAVVVVREQVDALLAAGGLTWWANADAVIADAAGGAGVPARPAMLR